MPRHYRFVQLDVFTEEPFKGNPLAVFPDADGLTGEEMQLLAREMNLSESTFVLPAEAEGAAVRVRIFTPTEELPYAGHPSVGTHWLLAAEGRHRLTGARTTLHQEVAAGVLRVDVDADVNGRPVNVLSTQAPPAFEAPVTDRDALAEGLGVDADALHPDLPAQVVTTGVRWLLVPLRDAAALDAVEMNPHAWHAVEREVGCHYVYPFVVTGDDDAFTRARSFVVNEFEDPVTGSASGCLGAYVARHRLRAPDHDGVLRFVNAQGAHVKRPGRVNVEVVTDADGGPHEVRVGGACVKVLEGTVEMP